jgi:phosphatidylglycerol---prolipoprotein diacylglyceryl transferase
LPQIIFMPTFNFIVWEASPEIFSIGSLAIRWYGLLFACGFLLGQQVMIRIFKLEGRSEKHVETLTLYMVIATIIGARLGHCLFYEPSHYLSHPLDILKIWEGGLASHGATLGILIAMYIYSRKQTDQSYLYILDRMAIIVVLAGCLIRIGNLMNSEIVGKPTDSAMGFVFVRSAEDRILENFSSAIKNVKINKNGKDSSINNMPLAGLDLTMEFKDKNIPAESVTNFIQNNLRETLNGYTEIQENIVVPAGYITQNITANNGTPKATIKIYGIPRHPAQLYEAISCLFLFLLLIYIYSKKKGATPEGRIFGTFMMILFTLRFLYEFIKAPQVDFENNMTLNMGQILSIPLIIVGIFILLRSYRKKNEIS